MVVTGEYMTSGAYYLGIQVCSLSLHTQFMHYALQIKLEYRIHWILSSYTVHALCLYLFRNHDCNNDYIMSCNCNRLYTSSFFITITIKMACSLIVIDYTMPSHKCSIGILPCPPEWVRWEYTSWKLLTWCVRQQGLGLWCILWRSTGPDHSSWWQCRSYPHSSSIGGSVWHHSCLAVKTRRNQMHC